MKQKLRKTECKNRKNRKKYRPLQQIAQKSKTPIRKKFFFFVLVFAKIGQRLEKIKMLRIDTSNNSLTTQVHDNSSLLHRPVKEHLCLLLFNPFPELPPHILLSSSFGRSIVEVTPWGRGHGVSRKVEKGNAP